MNGFKLYLRYVSLSLQGQMQYRMSFILMSTANFFSSFAEFLGMSVLFGRFGALNGWTLPEVAIFYGIVHTAFALAEAGARGFDVFHRQVITGDFDRLLLRPRSTVLQVIGQEFQVMRIGRFAQGLVVLIWAVIKLQVDWSFVKVSLLVASIIGGAGLFSGLFVLQATLSFWSVQSLEIVNTVTYGGVETSQVPLSIYGKWFRRFFIFIVPLGCINYFPLIRILERNDVLKSPLWVQYGSPLAGLIFFILSLQIWQVGVRHYRSTGS